MVRKLLVAVPLVFFASLILFISILRTAAVKYDYKGKMNEKKGFLSTLPSQVDYDLPFPGSVLPDNPLWNIKVVRDKLWLLITTDPYRKSDLKILFADKRLGSAKILFERNNPEVGMATLEKAERYLVEAANQEKLIRIQGGNTNELLDRLSRAALKHYELMQVMYESAPDEARPKLVLLMEIPKKVYEDARNEQLDKSIIPYANPFIW